MTHSASLGIVTSGFVRAFFFMVPIWKVRAILIQLFKKFVRGSLIMLSIEFFRGIDCVLSRVVFRGMEWCVIQNVHSSQIAYVTQIFFSRHC